MTGYIPKPIPICRICGMEADSGTMCQNCKDKIKMERRKAKKNVIEYINRDKRKGS